MAKRPITMTQYGDEDLYGPRAGEFHKLIRKLEASNNSECIIFSTGTFASKDQFKLRDLVGTDKRLRQLVEGMNISHAMPIQRYSWPKIANSAFACFYISPEKTGKTYAILLYAIAKCFASVPMSQVNDIMSSESSRHVINDFTKPEDLISHPKYVLICSSQERVEAASRTLDEMKEKAYGDFVTDALRHQLRPISRTISPDQDLDKLALRCNESDILIASPLALIKCLRQGFIDFEKCKKVFFDDLDQALQIQNYNVKELIKIYLIQTDCANPKISSSGSVGRFCRVHMFSRKWTDLLKQFASNIFPQSTLLFGSLAEAAIYANIKFEVECFKRSAEEETLSRLISSLVNENSSDKIAIVCNTAEEAELSKKMLTERGYGVKSYDSADKETVKQLKTKLQVSASRNLNDMIFVMSDSALEFEVEYSSRRRTLNDITHLIHKSIPDDMMAFDQRFRLLSKNIEDDKKGIKSTLLLQDRTSFRLARQIHDLISRSSTTIKSTKCIIRDFIPQTLNQICWRWATFGLCRFDKLSRDDCFGSYCPDKHSIKPQAPKGCCTTSDNLPSSGMVRITITHIVSPSEFYFWFEGIRRDADGSWSKIDCSGSDSMKKLQVELDSFKNMEKYSVPLNKVTKGSIFGVHFPQDLRVDRVLLLDGLECASNTFVNQELEYSRQIPVFKLDYGVCIEVYVKNLILLPESSTKVPAQSHRAFHLGFRPKNTEPNWSYKSKKLFYDFICSKQHQQITAWIRLARDDCYWFDNLLISRQLSNIDCNDVCVVNPMQELQAAGLADQLSSEPLHIPPSNRHYLLCIWNNDKLARASQCAFLPQEAAEQEIYLLNIRMNSLDIIVRQAKFDEQLIELERQLMLELGQGKILQHECLNVGVICLASIKSSLESRPCLNRAKVISIQEKSDCELDSTEIAETIITVECVDYGDRYRIPKNNVYQASVGHIKRLPFQAIECKLANLNTSQIDNLDERSRFVDAIYDLTRDENNDLKKLRYKQNVKNEIYLFVPNNDANCYVPLHKLMQDLGKQLHNEYDDKCQQIPEYKSNFFSDNLSSLSYFVSYTILQLLQDVVSSELMIIKQQSA